MSSTLLSARSGATAPVGTALILLLALFVGMGFAFSDTLAAMVQVWSTENFQHGYLVGPIALWLAWRNRKEVLAQPLAPFWPAVIPLIGACAAWMVGRLAGVNIVEQFALLAMLPSALTLAFGWRVTWALAYPLGFLVFAVPFGEAFYPVMMKYTADFTVYTVRLSGVPVFQEDLFFELPTGRWSVIEACSGLRYLLAALPLATLYAYLSWQSWLVRSLFIALAAIVAIVGNWLRAYLIVMIGHLSGMQLAVGVDHLIYGWIFFGIVMAVVFWIGSRWPDRRVARSVAPPQAPRVRDAGPTFLALALVAALGVIGAAVAGVGRLQDQGEPTVRLQAFQGALIDDASLREELYRPVYAGGVARLEGHLAQHPEVGFLAVQYVRQHRHGEMITYENSVNPARTTSDRTWRVRSQATRDPGTLGAAFPDAAVNEYRITHAGESWLVWEWFWTNGRTLNDPRRVKLQTSLDLLRGRGDESLAFVAWVPIEGDTDKSRALLAAAVDGLQARARAAGL